MRLLIDTNALVWWLTEFTRLTRGAYDAIEDPDNDVFVTVVSAYEISYKAHLGKFPEVVPAELGDFVYQSRFEWLNLGYGEMRTAATLDWDERDPWDRMIVAQAILNECVVVSADRAFRSAPVETLW